MPRRSPNPLPPSEHRAWQAEVQTAQESDLHGDRIEHRRLFTTTRLNDYLDWPGVQQVCRMDRTRTLRGKTTHETAYAITSLSPDQAGPEDLLRLWRGHWRIENSLHYVRDVTFGEDACRVRSGHAPQLLAAARNAVVSLLNLNHEPNRAAALRRYANRPELAFRALGLRLEGIG